MGHAADGASARMHWNGIADLWLSAVLQRGAHNPAGVILPGRVTADGVRRESMETIGRSFLLASSRIAGAEPSDATADALIEFYAQAIVDGTSPEHPSRWPLGVTCRPPLTGITNSIVEAANLAFGLYTAGDRFWQRFSDAEQQQVLGWLRHHAQREVWQNNWQLFPAMAEAFIRHRGGDTRGLRNERNVARVEGWYLGDGWYTDGPGHAIDYYNAWAIHPYLWAWYRMTDRTQTPDGQRHLERLAQFVDGLSTFIAADGALVHFGRSLTYRTAALAPLWCAEISGVSPLSPGRTRQLATSVLDGFVDHGVGADGQLSLGWYDECLDSMQDYSGFGSPYLAGIGFLGLSLGDGHPVWNAPAEPVAAPPRTRAFDDTGLSISTAGGDAPVVLINHGSDHADLPVQNHGIPDGDDPHYASFAYSTHTAPEVGAGWLQAVDGHIALFDSHGRPSRRVKIRGTAVEGAMSASVHLPQIDGALIPGAHIVTASVVNRGMEVRAHLVTAPLAHDRLREGAFALAAGAPPAVSSDARALTAEAVGDAHRVVLTGLHGWEEPAVVERRGVNAMGEYSAIPTLWATRSSAQTVHVALHQLLDADEDPVAARLDLQVSVDGTRICVQWPDDGIRVDLDLCTVVPWDGQPGRIGGARV
ncbi:DUF2264 domain-containing protein [Microbacterium esteraromaticum]|uniref:DUF2264 domain-containing protein n=1 Tax=Microbacterium esteraromaticum TaxID=57043 RepID=UPI0019D3CDEC|nr:DUF2264 domain-containing protein [Microbacterium esteraromaticum]MBN7793695.1 DUF2264 domain-containing protein [Microbacterium esteraromaticum]